MEMMETKSAGNPTAPGYYAVYISNFGAPRVLWWGVTSHDWREGARRVDVSHYLGPIPQPKEPVWPR